jgi:GNAT superfamily N-acetyltransferase
MYSLVLASIEDFEDVSRLAKELFYTSVYAKHSLFNETRVKDLLAKSSEMSLDEVATVLLKRDNSTVGFITIASQPSAYSEDKIAIELGFYILPEDRNFKTIRMLMNAYYYWAKSTSCSLLFQGRIVSPDLPEIYKIRSLH